MPYLLSGVIVKPTSVSKLFCDRSILTKEHVNVIPPRLLTKITKSPKYAVTCNFFDSTQVDKDFRHCFSRCCLTDPVVFCCMGLLRKGTVFTFAHTEIAGGASPC